MRRIVISFAALFALSACPGGAPGFPCSETADCTEDFVCIDGTCVANAGDGDGDVVVGDGDGDGDVVGDGDGDVVGDGDGDVVGDGDGDGDGGVVGDGDGDGDGGVVGDGDGDGDGDGGVVVDDGGVVVDDGGVVVDDGGVVVDDGGVVVDDGGVVVDDGGVVVDDAGVDAGLPPVNLADCAVLNGNADLNNQGRVSDFITDNSLHDVPCLIVNGDLTFDTANITDLSVLEVAPPNYGIVQVTGFLKLNNIDDAAITNVDFLQNLISVGTDLDIIGSSGLVNIDGFHSLTSVGGELNIDANPNLNVTAADRAFAALTSVGTNLKVQGNDSLGAMFNFPSLTTVPGNLEVKTNASLTDLSGLASVTSVGGNLKIETHTILASTASLAGVQTVGGEFKLKDNSTTLVDLTMPSLTQVGSFSLDNNDGLQVLTGLDPLQRVETKITMARNELRACVVQVFIDRLEQIAVGNSGSTAPALSNLVGGDAVTAYPDGDGDGDGAYGQGALYCAGGEPGAPASYVVPPNHVDNGNDCDDTVSTIKDGTNCDDGAACTTYDSCQQGVCRGAPTTSCGGQCATGISVLSGCPDDQCCFNNCVGGNCNDCPAGGMCGFECQTATCEVTCEAGSICYLDANSLAISQDQTDRLAITCEQDAACSLYCLGAESNGCHLDCTSSSSRCLIDCAGLSPGSECTMSCPGGDFPERCSNNNQDPLYDVFACDKQRDCP